MAENMGKKKSISVESVWKNNASRFRALKELLEISYWQWNFDEEGNLTEIWGNDNLKQIFGYRFEEDDVTSIDAWLAGVTPE